MDKGEKVTWQKMADFGYLCLCHCHFVHVLNQGYFLPLFVIVTLPIFENQWLKWRVAKSVLTPFPIFHCNESEKRSIILRGS